MMKEAGRSLFSNQGGIAGKLSSLLTVWGGSFLYVTAWTYGSTYQNSECVNEKIGGNGYARHENVA